MHFVTLTIAVIAGGRTDIIDVHMQVLGGEFPVVFTYNLMQLNVEVSLLYFTNI